MLEERYYTYDTIGNLLSFRHRYPSSGWGTGSIGSGEQMEGGSYNSRGTFNPMTQHGLTSETYESAGILPFIAGHMYSTAGPNNTRGAIGSAGQSISTNYVNYGAFNGLSGAGAATNYNGRGINPYVYGPDGGSSGGQGGGYTGPTGETIINYTYGQNGAGPHAVTSRSNGDSFSYDENGNMTSRTMNGVTWTQVFDAENRLIEVDDGTTETTYVYDGAGNRIKRIVDDGTTVTTTLYVAGMEIELVDSVESQRKIYYASGGAFRIIGGEDEGLYFKHGDHLGSTSVLSDSTGAKVADSDVLYAPFGEIRTGNLSELTDFGFTGQILDRSSGDLMYYGARYYLPGLKRFISADTIVPSVLNGQSLNRYSYVKNNPVKYIDPTGHDPEEGSLEWWQNRYYELVAAGEITPSTGGGDGGGSSDGSTIK